MALQVLIVLSGAIPLYLASKKILRSKFLSLGLIIAYMTFGGLQMGYAYGFHEIIVFPTFFFWTYYFYISKKMWWYIAFIILTLCIKEETAFIILILGLYLFISKQNKLYAFITTTLGFLWYLLVFNVFIPFFNHGNAYAHWGQYQSGESGLFSIVKRIVMDPIAFLQLLINPPYKIETIFHTFAPFAFLPLLYPPSIIIVLPSLLEKLMTGDLASYSG
jgi:uncharacterized membrane protein